MKLITLTIETATNELTLQTSSKNYQNGVADILQQLKSFGLEDTIDFSIKNVTEDGIVIFKI